MKTLGNKPVVNATIMLNAKALDTLSRCISEGKARTRNFQRQLVTDGLHLKAYPFSKIIDVDHCTDIPKAEELVKSFSKD